jgi:hypothetical protein
MNNLRNEGNASNSESNEIVMEKECGCTSSCGCAMNDLSYPSYVYSLGRIGYNFPNESVTNEAQAGFLIENIQTGTETEKIYQLLTKKEYRYLARELCWTFKVGYIQTFVVIPKDPNDYEAFVESLSYKRRGFLDGVTKQDILTVIVGEKGPMCPPGMCGGLTLPIVTVDRIQTFKIKDMSAALIKKAKDSNLKPDRVTEQDFQGHIEDLWDKMLYTSENSEGSDPTSRAVNYLTWQSLDFYLQSAIIETSTAPHFLEDIQPQPVKTIGSAKIVQVLFRYRTQFSVETYGIDVDVTYKYPYLRYPFRRLLS